MMSSSKSGAIIYLMISDRAPFDRPQKVVLLINLALPDDASRVRFTGCHSGKSITVEAEKHGSRALIVLTPIFFHPEPCHVAVVSRTNYLPVCEYQQNFLFTSNLMRLRELFTQVLDPVDFMCSACHVSPSRLDILDTQLEKTFKEKVPVCFDLFNGNGGNDYEVPSSCAEFPTLLHFAARYGLWKLCYTLIKCHGGHKALSAPNKDGLEPHRLAEKHGHEALYHALEETKSNVSCSSISTDEGIYEAFGTPQNDLEPVYTFLPASSTDDNYETMIDPYKLREKNTEDDHVVIKEIVSQLESMLSLPHSKMQEKLDFLYLYAKTKLMDSAGEEESAYEAMNSVPDQTEQDTSNYMNVHRDECSNIPATVKHPTPGGRPTAPPRRPSSGCVGRTGEDTPQYPVPAPRPPSLKCRPAEHESPYIPMNNAPALQSPPPVYPRGAP